MLGWDSYLFFGRDGVHKMSEREIITGGWIVVHTLRDWYLLPYRRVCVPRLLGRELC